MQQLTGLDEMFLGFDTFTTNGNLGGIMVFEGTTSSGATAGADGDGDRLAWLKRRIEERLPTLPPLRWRVTPLGMLNYWTEAPVDLDYHVERIVLDHPGTDRQLLDVLSPRMGQLLDRTRPMWKMFLFEGLEHGRYAYVLKLPHGLIDGATLWQVVDHLADEPVTDPSPTPVRPEGPAEFSEGLAKESANRMADLMELQRGMGEFVAKRMEEEQGGALAALAGRLIPGEMGRPFRDMANSMRVKGAPEVHSMRPVLVPPRSPFNGTTTPNVGLAIVDVSVDDLRRAGKLAGGTINDAMLAVSAGALREYMESHGGVPTKPLLASAPVSWRTGKERERWGNQIWMLFLQIPTHIADPVARVHLAHEYATAAKETWDRLPGSMLRTMSSFMPGSMMGMAMGMWAAMPAEMMPAVYNVSISNVRGPSERPSFGGNPMARYFVHGFLAPSTGLLVGGQSLGDRMVISFTACKDLVPDYQDLPALFDKHLAELLAAEGATPPES